jgi:uncharacterized cupredoxin-like copper-binding protein
MDATDATDATDAADAAEVAHGRYASGASSAGSSGPAAVVPRRRAVAAACVLAGALFVRGARAHGEAPHAAGAVRREQKPWGIAGDPRRVSRTVEVVMNDAMRFVPDRIEVAQGDTLRLVLRNTGRLMHEWVLGTREELAAHAALMARFPGMEHDEPYMAHVAPGRVGEIVWHFNRAGTFGFACLIAGHHEAGMIGKLEVLPRGSRAR